uniref:(California timema) hypothetical protein n=1 Tax=Timema californicum TaxID=61474 RepID=A0A7R9J8S0_TIMCA|nr:unnamed protein product [Timema californicum]
MVKSYSCVVVPTRQPVHDVHIPKSSPWETLHVDVTKLTAHTLLAATHQARTVTDYTVFRSDPEPAHHGVLPSFGNALVRTRNMDIVIKNMKALYEITDNQELVLNQDTLEVFSPDLMLSHIRRLVRERDEYLQNWTCLVTQERVEGGDQLQQKALSPVSGGDNHHLAVELADWKARLRKQRQELEEKSEALTETREELEHSKILLTKLRQEVQELMQDARAAKALRDELDVMRERAERVDKLESEVQRYREKLSDVEFYKTRVDELREDNKVLLETKDMLEEQLQRARKRGDHVLELESELLKYKQQVNELAIEQEAGREKMQELYEENAQLQVLMKSALNETSTVSIESEAGDDFEGGSGDNSLSEQLSSNAQARALKLELENRRLLSTIDNLKESSFHESSSTILELEKEKKKMSIKAEKSRMSELEANMDTITKEKQRVQCLVDSLQRRLEELERSLESNNTQLEHWRTEAGKIPTLQARSSEASTRIEELERETQNFQREVTRLKENQEVKDVSLDKYSSEMASMQKEINKYVKELDDATSQIASSTAEDGEIEVIISVRLHELERESQELMRRAAVDRQTLTTLKGDLVAQKLSTQQLKTNLEKLGLDLDWLLDPDTALERQVHHFFETLTQFMFQYRFRIASSQEIQKAVHDLHSREGTLYNCSKCQSQQTTPDEPQTQDIPSTDSMAELCRLCDDLRQEVATLQGSADALHTENARLQVDVATLRSQVGSLTTQHTALQLANSQLAVEKDELVKEKGLQKSAHQQLLLDQMTLQSLHEQLSTEYESLQQERDALKVVQRDLKLEVRTLKEQNTTHAAVEQERDKLRTESRSLGNLRAEHSSLKDDFRNLFTASEKLKLEFRNLQEEYRSLRTDSGNLKLLNLELKGELTKRSDHVTMLEVELSKLTNRCEILLHMNTGLEDDRRSLMEHVSKLLSQYHELLTHSLEDKEHFHCEEKLFTDKVNNLCRQKEKLEEKIMEHYRKMESCSTKKKSFGATLVKRVRKAGSDLISKVPRNRRSWHEGSRLAESKVSLSHVSDTEGENESDDSSTEDHKNRTLTDGQNPERFMQSSLSLGSAGTRRAVYYTGEEHNGTKTSPQEPTGEDDNVSSAFQSADNPPGDPSASTPQNDRFLVYNRISTVIGTVEDKGAAPTPKPPSPNPSKLGGSDDNTSKKGSGKTKGKGESSIWYEYGCV